MAHDFHGVYRGVYEWDWPVMARTMRGRFGAAGAAPALDRKIYRARAWGRQLGRIDGSKPPADRSAIPGTDSHAQSPAMAGANKRHGWVLWTGRRRSSIGSDHCTVAAGAVPDSSRWALSPVQIACSWWRPRRATTGPSSRSRPLGRTSQDQIIRVAPAAGSKVNPPSTSTEGMVVREPNLLGLWDS